MVVEYNELVLPLKTTHAHLENSKIREANGFTFIYAKLYLNIFQMNKL